MYTKNLYNFQETLSYNLVTAQKQSVRFERHCRHILKPLLNTTEDTLHARLDLAWQSRFLFSPEHCIRKPIQHLKFYDHYSFVTETAKDYTFMTPFHRYKNP